MPRTARVQFPGAIYHVINRGNYRAWIFEDEKTKAAFRKCLFEACEFAGWTLHAYCIMGNHYHLALETPKPNLSEGMKWLQSVFANRFNRFRKERGHLFQGRFKSILVEDWERLAWLCHYIHLNPVRAGICEVEGLQAFPYSSYWNLLKIETRKKFMRFDGFLEGAGELKDTPAGRAKYQHFLSWLQENDQAKRTAAFERMSKGWALGSKDFKTAVIEDQKARIASLQLGSKTYAEMREDLWSSELERCLQALGKSDSDIACDPKSADWKVAVAAHLKRTHLCKNPWISEKLRMGVGAAISRYCSELTAGKRQSAEKILKQIGR